MQLGCLIPNELRTCAQTDVRQAFLEYRYTAAARGGSLFIRPISESHMHDTTELLTQSFSEAMGYMSVYRCSCPSPSSQAHGLDKPKDAISFTSQC